MTDRELLKLAAKAVDHFVLPIYGADDGKLYDRDLNEWNPIADDGDALRLTVKLKLSVTVFNDAVGVGYKTFAGQGFYFEEPLNGDPASATRRAIVLAAAEIGRQA